MLVENKHAVRLVELLKESKKLNQNKSRVSFNADGSRCSLTLVWKSKKMKILECADADVVGALMQLIAWSMSGAI